MGKTTPDPTGNQVTDSGLLIPLGKGADSGVQKTNLLYNEYIVYDTAQVKQKYLVQVKFNFKGRGTR